MEETKITQVMMDDSTLNVNKEVDMVFSIANTLRGPYKADKYKDIIIPMIIIRRLECALATKDASGKIRKQKVIEKFDANPKTPQKVLENLAGYPFYNTSKFDLAGLLNEAPAIVENFHFYLESFSPNIKDMLITRLKFKEKISDLDKNNRLLGVVKKFSELDLNPETIDGHKMGYMFEEIIRRFSENAEAGDHYTPREVIRALSSILLAEGCDDVFSEGTEITVLDMACGTGGMLWNTSIFQNRTHLAPMDYTRVYQNHKFKVPSYTAMAVGLELTLHETEDALRLSGLGYDNSDPTDCAYMYILSAFHGCSIDECNTVLEKLNVKSLGTKSKNKK